MSAHGEKGNAYRFDSLVEYADETKAKGIANLVAAFDCIPFAIIAVTLRGTREILIDMRRSPDKLHVES